MLFMLSLFLLRWGLHACVSLNCTVVFPAYKRVLRAGGGGGLESLEVHLSPLISGTK